jgi:hypothetical protein
MAKFIWNRFIKEYIWTMWPAFAALLATLIIATFITEFTFTSGGKALGSILWRFLRLFLNLTFPLLFLPVICALVQQFLNRKPGQLVQVEKVEDTVFHPFQAWVIRPLQGIGILMLMAAHFLGPLGAYLGSSFTGPTISTIPTMPPPGELTIGRFVNLAVTSILLSFVWTMDDLGIRQYNRKTEEIKRVGKYLGSLLPILTGFYAIYSLFKDQPPAVAFLMIVQRVIIFYPPLVIFNVLHTHYLNGRKDILLKKLKASSVTIRADAETLSSPQCR